MSSTPDDFSAKIPFFAELEKLMSQEGPVNWDLARQVAIRAAAGVGEATAPSAAATRPADSAQSAAVAEAVRLADLWLDPVTVLPSGLHRPAQAWSPVQWIEQTISGWKGLCEPVAGRVGATMGETLSGGLAQLGSGEALPPELLAALPPGLADAPGGLAAGMGPMLAMMRSLSGMMFGAQVGQGIGSLAGEVLTSTEVGLPLGPPGLAALVPRNIAAFGEGLAVPQAEVELYLALREAAHHRLYGSAEWLRGHVLRAVEDYARGIRVDPEGINRLMTSIDPSDPESLSRAMGSGMFEGAPSPEQQRALDRLELILALVEGWVDEVVDAASRALPSAPALRETVRRRRAEGGPAEQTFATLVGLQLRPRRLRDAAALWGAVAGARGVGGRDAVWDHPDLLPTATDLDDPSSFAPPPSREPLPGEPTQEDPSA